MKIEPWFHTGVRADGAILSEEGTILEMISISPKIIRSPDIGGCGAKDCSCSIGWWITICYGYNESDSSIAGVTIYFDSQFEYMDFLISGVAAIQNPLFSMNPN